MKLDNNVYLSTVYFESGYRYLSNFMLKKDINNEDLNLISMLKQDNILLYQEDINRWKSFQKYMKLYTRKRTYLTTYNNILISGDQVNKHKLTFYDYYFMMDYSYREYYNYNEIFNHCKEKYNKINKTDYLVTNKDFEL